MSEEELEPPEGIPPDIWEKFQEQDKILKEGRVKRFSDELKDNPPKPPWLKYPDCSRYSIFWRMGAGESYLLEYIWPYFEYSTKEELERYKDKYPEPNEWNGWYKMSKI